MTARFRRGSRRTLMLCALTGLVLGTAAGPAASTPAEGGRVMERLDRGVVAVRSGEKEVLVSWRLLGLDPKGLGFDVERSTDGGPYRRLNREVLTGGTNYVDTTADLSRSNRYRVRPGKQPPSRPFTLTAGHAVEPVVRVPLREGGRIKFVWVGDLDGDGAYDYVVDRQTAPQKIEAYRSDGRLLWEMDLGPNSVDQNNIEGGSATVDVGHNDGVTVYDLDGDGRAEVAIRVADGVTFGDGSKHTESDDVRQSIAILDGRTGAPKAIAPVPGDYLADGPLYARFGVGYLDGRTPSLVAYMKNRIGSGDFNLMYTAWKYDGRALTNQWKFLRGDQDLPDGHNTRIVDVDGDGKDEVGEIGFLLNGDGTLRYSLAPQGIRHGDRWFIADIDPGHPGLEGYGIQQDHPEGLLDYYYGAADGKIIWKHGSAEPGADAGRGMVADIDPRFPGMETWSINGEVNYEQGRPTGLYNAPSNRLAEPDTTKQPWPHMGVWWDGDLLRELYNADPFPERRDARIEKWDPANPAPPATLPRVVTTSEYGAVTALGNSVYPHLIADIFGDWREEVVLTSPEFDELIIFTTDRPTGTRLYTLAHNPAYRNGMTLKGYLQASNVDYFLGHGMTAPPRPKIRY
ncbi:hypothetical protein AB0I81_48955 [Nonomuraea sp. NPDC050404]|uniref:rhamnogalacturonan lyase family protein n=1 Tax=Nonomuraea sp. NPDC050404 TaxID=3155783 RepID=UPI00340ABBF8